MKLGVNEIWQTSPSCSVHFWHHDDISVCIQCDTLHTNSMF